MEQIVNKIKTVLDDMPGKYGYTLQDPEITLKLVDFKLVKIHLSVTVNALYNISVDGACTDDVVDYLETEVKSFPLSVHIPDKVYYTLIDKVLYSEMDFFEAVITNDVIFCAEIVNGNITDYYACDPEGETIANDFDIDRFHEICEDEKNRLDEYEETSRYTYDILRQVV